MMAEQMQFPVASALPAASALGTNVKTNVPKIYDIMRGCKERKTGCMQPAVDEIVALCLSTDLAYKKNILGRHCGIHPENRAKTGVDPLNAQNLALKISLQGYSESKLENPMGFEKAPLGDGGCISPSRVHDKELRHVQRLSSDYSAPRCGIPPGNM